MYESFYGLTDKPFSMLPDPGFLYLSKQHQTALTLLEYALVNQAGFCVVTGEPGAGKTTLLRKLLETVEDNIAVGMITNTHKSFGDLLDWVLSAFNIHEPDLNKVQQNQKFTDFLLDQYAKGKSALLIVDEAQNIKAETLEELRMLSNVNSEKDQLLQIILAGQPALKDTLRQPELMQFAQRIGVDYHLDTLNAQETCNYIQHRLVTAGATDDVFTPAACLRIHEYSGGTPRLINLICDTAMVYGFADQMKRIDADTIDEMVRERMRDSVVPLFKNVQDKTQSQAQSAAEELDNKQAIDFPWINPGKGGDNATTPAVDSKPATQQAAPAQTEAPAPQASPVAAGRDEKASAANTEQPAAKPAPAATVAAEAAASKTAGKKNAAQKDEQAVNNDAGAQPAGAKKQRDFTVSTVDDAEPPKKNGGKWWLLAFAVMLLVLAVVVMIAINNNREIERLQKEAEQKLQLEIQRKEQAAAELARKLEREQQEKLARERELQRKAEQLQKERDAALKKAEQEAAERARQQELAEKIRKQKEAEKRRLKLEAEKRRRETELKLKREQEALAKKLKAEQQRLERIRLEQLRAEQEKAEAERRARQLAAEKAARQRQLEQQEAAARQAAREKQESGFSSDPCSGPTAKFLSSCR